MGGQKRGSFGWPFGGQGGVPRQGNHLAPPAGFILITERWIIKRKKINNTTIGKTTKK
jgi:hypothetical protein